MSNTGSALISLRTPLLDESIFRPEWRAIIKKANLRSFPTGFYLARANDERYCRVGARRDFVDASAALDR
jgi:hypothetical protein